MLKSKCLTLFAAGTMTLLSFSLCHAVGPQYENYKPSSTKVVYFEIGFDDLDIILSVPTERRTIWISYERADLVTDGDKVIADGDLIIDRDGVWIEGELYRWDRVIETRIREEESQSVISFLTIRGDDKRADRMRRGNRVNPDRKLTVHEDEFIRGMVFSATGDIDVFGEVNKDAVALFGDLFVAPGAVVRGDASTIGGRIDVAPDAAIYGRIFSGTADKRIFRHRFRRTHNEFQLNIDGSYNRVDGFSLLFPIRFHDPDSLLPSVWLKIGYAFEAKRGRYEIGMEQTLLRSLPLSIGGIAYRRLVTEDNYISGAENTTDAVFDKEDYRDYFEAEGAKVSVKARFMSDMLFEGGFRYEELNWLEAERDLWAVFGPDKKFRSNYSSVAQPFRDQQKDLIDTSAEAVLYARLDYDTRNKDDYYGYSAWALTGWVEWSNPDLGSDFDYTRYAFSLRRYQKFGRYLMLLLRTNFGASEGNLPMHRRYYLGGLGTLHGYKQKELIGTRYWMANAEYRVDFPKTDLAGSIFWDIGQIANEMSLSEAEVKNSLGISLNLGDDFKLSLAKRLDARKDDDPVFYIRTAHVF